MSEAKQNRIDQLDKCKTELFELSTMYHTASPIWHLIKVAYGHVDSCLFLEKDSTLPDETLGGKECQ